MVEGHVPQGVEVQVLSSAHIVRQACDKIPRIDGVFALTPVLKRHAAQRRPGRLQLLEKLAHENEPVAPLT